MPRDVWAKLLRLRAGAASLVGPPPTVSRRPEPMWAPHTVTSADPGDGQRTHCREGQRRGLRRRHAARGPFAGRRCRGEGPSARRHLLSIPGRAVANRPSGSKRQRLPGACRGDRHPLGSAYRPAHDRDQRPVYRAALRQRDHRTPIRPPPPSGIAGIGGACQAVDAWMVGRLDDLAAQMVKDPLACAELELVLTELEGKLKAAGMNRLEHDIHALAERRGRVLGSACRSGQGPPLLQWVCRDRRLLPRVRPRLGADMPSALAASRVPGRANFQAALTMRQALRSQ